MKRTNVKRRKRETRKNRLMFLLVAAVVLVGVITEIAMMSRLNAQNKQIYEVERQIIEWGATVDNLNMNLEKYSERERVQNRAVQIGMVKAEGAQLRVLNLPGLVENTSTQSADNSGAEGIMD